MNEYEVYDDDDVYVEEEEVIVVDDGDHEYEEEEYVDEEVVEDNDDEEDNDENFLASIQKSMLKEFNARKSQQKEREQSSLLAAAKAKEEELKQQKQQQEEEILEEEEYYEDQVIEKWFQVDTLPDNLEEACRKLIPIVYKGEEYVDPDTMMRRTPLPELYKYLKQHYDYKKDVKKEINDETAQQVDSTVTQKQCSLQEIFQKRAQTTETVNSNHDAVEAEEEYEIEEEIVQSPIRSTGKKHEVEVKVNEEETQEDSIKRWLQSDDLPDDIEVACKTLIPLVYDDDEHVDANENHASNTITRIIPIPKTKLQTTTSSDCDCGRRLKYHFGGYWRNNTKRQDYDRLC